MRIFPVLALLALTACSFGSSTPTESPAEQASIVIPAGESTPTAQRAEAPIRAKAQVGDAAPNFTLKDLDGTEHTLAAHKGKTVVLEWFNPGCPYVVAAYDGGPLQTMVAQYQARDVVWLAINSGAPGKQGHGVEVNRKAKADWAMTQPILLDEDGVVGKAYGARTTPHMYVIDPEGVLVYAGALDNAPRNELPATGHVGFTRDAIEATLAGDAVRASKTQAWGCSVKYGS